MRFYHPRLFQYALSSIMFGCIIILVIYYKDEFWGVLKRADLFWFATGILCYAFNYLCRAYRLRELTLSRTSLLPIFFKVSVLHGFNSYLLPLRSGDISLPFLLHVYDDLPLVQGGKVLIRARFLDVLSLGVMVTAVCFFSSSNLSFTMRYLFLVTGVCLILFPYGAVFVVKRELVSSHKWYLKVFGNDVPVYPDVKEIGMSLLVWFWTGSTIYCVIRALHIPLSFFDVWFLVAVQLPLQLLPVQGVANSGNHEAGWVAALSILGVEVSEGLPLALASHVILISYVVILGALVALLPSPSVQCGGEGG